MMYTIMQISLKCKLLFTTNIRMNEDVTSVNLIVPQLLVPDGLFFLFSRKYFRNCLSPGIFTNCSLLREYRIVPLHRMVPNPGCRTALLTKLGGWGTRTQYLEKDQARFVILCALRYFPTVVKRCYLSYNGLPIRSIQYDHSPLSFIIKNASQEISFWHTHI